MVTVLAAGWEREGEGDWDSIEESLGRRGPERKGKRSSDYIRASKRGYWKLVRLSPRARFSGVADRESKSLRAERLSI